jgi:tRNA dimethylallyltransferase
MKKEISVLSVVGPTATYKTRLSIELAKRLNGEIINADSMQIYKEMKIGTNRPTQVETGEVACHLFGFLSVSEIFSVASYVKIARELIKEISNRNKFPILCGGTGLYIKSLLSDNTFLKDGTNFKIRAKLEDMVKNQGINELFLKLKKIDPEASNRIHINDKKRIIRALELYYSSGKTLTEQNNLSKNIPLKYNVRTIGLNYSKRENLYSKINSRVDSMISRGLVQEVCEVLSMQCSKTARSAIGYKEFTDFLKSKCSLDEVIEKVKTKTRRYAKRQLTWFLKDESVFWIYIDDYKNFNEVILKAESFAKSHFAQNC